MTECPFCAESINDNLKSCPHCKSKLIIDCPYCAETILAKAVKCKHCLSALHGNQTKLNIEDIELTRLANLEKLSGIIWIVIAIIQIFIGCAFPEYFFIIIIGIWNMFTAFSRFKVAKQILAQDAEVPETYQSIVPLIVILVINLFLGAMLGIFAVFFDFYIRDQILNRKNLFTNTNNTLETIKGV